MPSPSKGETQQAFISRCMGSSEAQGTFPRQDQRAAFCYSQWRNRRAAKGYPEYNPSQERGEDGKWTGGAGGGGSNAHDLRTASDNVVKALLTRAFPGMGVYIDRYATGGIEISVNDANQADRGDQFSIAFSTVDMNLQAGNLSACDDAAGRKFARAAIYTIRQFAVNSGAESISTTGGSVSGGYAWPRLGFQLESNDDLEAVRGNVASRLIHGEHRGWFTAAMVAKAEDILNVGGNDFAHQIALLDDPVPPEAVRYARGRRRPTLGKALLMGTLANYVMPRARFHMLGRFSKGYPEFNPDQDRGEDGQWVTGGGWAESRRTIKFDSEDQGAYTKEFKVYTNLNFVKPAGSVELYHSTYPEHVTSIMQNGLVPGSGVFGGSVWHVSPRTFRAGADMFTEDEATVVSWVPRKWVNRDERGVSTDEVDPQWIKEIYVHPNASIAKGYPEFNPDQDRGEDGQWVTGGGSVAPRRTPLDARGRSNDQLRDMIATRFPEGTIIKVVERAADGTREVVVRTPGLDAAFLVKKDTIYAGGMHAADNPVGRRSSVRFMLMLRDMAIDSGATHIDTYAADSMGGWAWPRAGFNLVAGIGDRSVYNTVVERFESVKYYLSVEQQTKVSTVLASFSANAPTFLANLDDPMPQAAVNHVLRDYHSHGHTLRGTPTLGKLLLVGSQGYYRLPRAKFDHLTRLAKAYAGTNILAMLAHMEAA